MNLLGRTPNLHRRNIIEKGRWKSLQCRLRNSCCSGDRWVGEQSCLISSSDRVFAAELYSGTELGIQPTSGLDGDLRFSQVVVIFSSFESVTKNLRTPASSM